MLPKLTLGLILLMTMLFLLVAADWIYGPYSDLVRNVLVVYFLLFVMVMAAMKSGMPLMGVSPFEIRGFALGFLATAVIVMFLPFGTLGGMFTSGEINVERVKLAMGFGLLHGFVKAFIEESVFRGILLKRVGMVVSNLLFGGFHIGIIILTLTTLGVPVTFMAVVVPVSVLIGLGFVWSFVAVRFGLMAAVGSHLAWNLKVLGVLEKIIGGK